MSRRTIDDNSKTVNSSSDSLGYAVLYQYQKGSKTAFYAVLDIDGRRQKIADWAAEWGISRQTLSSRVERRYPLALLKSKKRICHWHDLVGFKRRNPKAGI